MRGEDAFRHILDALPAAVYVTDAAGRITYYNEAAAALWGQRPQLGTSQWCGSSKLCWPDGRPMPHDQCAMAVVLRDGLSARGQEAIAVRPDGTRLPFAAYPTLLRDASGAVIGAVNMLVDISDRQRSERHVWESEGRYRGIFENARVALLEEDFSGVVALLDDIRAEGVEDLRAHLSARPDLVSEALRRVRVIDVNAFALELFEAERKEALTASLAAIFLPETLPTFIDELVTLWNGGRRFHGETAVKTTNGRRLDVTFTMAFEGERFETTLVSILDTSAQKAAERAYRRQTHRLETLNKIARTISGELDLDRIVQSATDAATELSGAKLGAFFYRLVAEGGEIYRLYALSGAPAEAFATFDLPCNTAIFDATFRTAGIIRADDIRTDPRHGTSGRHLGMPPGLLQVASYLAVPVVSRTGEVHGGLLFGHDEPGVFTQESAELVQAIAAQTAIAIDSSRLLQASQRLAAIVESSDDAILAKDLDGIITSWNQGAERLYGYTAAEMIGKPVTLLIPSGRPNEEPSILARLRRGERIDHYETVRRRKDGSVVDISLTVSPIRNAQGEITGASKIARDISDRKRAQERQELLLREMNHRAKNLFALSSSVVTLSARSARTPQDLAVAVVERLGALSRAHGLTLPRSTIGTDVLARTTTLHTLIETILSPYAGSRDDGGPRVVVRGTDVEIGDGAMTSFALLIHEFATNAAKYGALSASSGHVEIDCSEEGDRLFLVWSEHGGPRIEPPDKEGFGTLLGRATVQGQLGGDISREWKPEGLRIRLTVARDRLAAVPA